MKRVVFGLKCLFLQERYCAIYNFSGKFWKQFSHAWFRIKLQISRYFCHLLRFLTCLLSELVYKMVEWWFKVITCRLGASRTRRWTSRRRALVSAAAYSGQSRENVSWRQWVALLLHLLATKGYLGCENSLSFSNKKTFGTQAVSPATEAFMPLQDRIEPVIPASGAFRRALFLRGGCLATGAAPSTWSRGAAGC